MTETDPVAAWVEVPVIIVTEPLFFASSGIEETRMRESPSTDTAPLMPVVSCTEPPLTPLPPDSKTEPPWPFLPLELPAEIDKPPALPETESPVDTERTPESPASARPEPILMAPEVVLLLADSINTLPVVATCAEPETSFNEPPLLVPLLLPAAIVIPPLPMVVGFVGSPRKLLPPSILI